jgi:hypothetical protein
VWPVDYGDPWELNRYGYVGGNPGNYSDPTGWTAVDWAKTIASIKAGTLSVLTAKGRQAAIIYARVVYAAFVNAPWIVGLTCLAAGFVTDANIDPVCQNSADDLGKFARQTQETIAQLIQNRNNFRVFWAPKGSNNVLETISYLVRRIGQLSDIDNRGDKNIALAYLNIGDNPLIRIWGVSGNGNDTRRVEGIITELSSGADLIAPLGRPAIDDNNIFPSAPDHAEQKIWEEINRRLNGLSAEQHSLPIRVILYTERIPCPRCTDMTGRFFDTINTRGFDLSLDVIFTYPSSN